MGYRILGSALGLALILTGFSASPSFALAATGTPAVSIGSSADSALRQLKDMAWSWFASSSALEADPKTGAAGAEDARQKIERGNSWLKEVTGLSLAEILIAAWKLFIWLAMAVFRFLWAFASWMMSILPQG